jgi:hypothetical protein
MTKLLTFSAAAVVFAAFFGSAAPAAAASHEFCRRDITEYGALSCSFDTLAQCQAMASGRGGDCLRDPSLGSGAGAYAFAPTARGTYAYAPITRKHHQK